MIAIEAENLGKRYRMRGLGPQTLFGKIRDLAAGKKPETRWAIREASFQVRQGQTVGLVGQNGSGKSTTLALAAGTIHPTTGSIKAHGRISSLLELGTGFHPDLSGRENVFLNAALLGIPQENIRKRLDHIIGFSGLKEFIDEPVKTYSTGMYLRLGFAVATEVDPDILLLDEVLAVGDIAFGLKCKDRIRQFQKKGKTLIFVSHDLQAVEEFCDEVFLFHDQRIVKRGAPSDVILSYVRDFMGEGGGLYKQEFGTRQVEFGDVKLVDAAGQETTTFTCGEAFKVIIPYTAHERIEQPVFGYSIKTASGLSVYGTNTQIQGHVVDVIEGEGRVELVVDRMLLRKGNYFLSLAIHSADHETQFHRREDWYLFAMKNEDDANGPFNLGSSWCT